MKGQFEVACRFHGGGHQQTTGILAQPVPPRRLPAFPIHQLSPPGQSPPLGATIMMPTALAEQTVAAIDNQDASPLFKIPLELRRAIYANLVDVSARHICSVAGSDGISRLRFTLCIAPGPSDEDYLDGSERCPELYESDIPVAGPIFKRRLLSSWGPHWMCEELAFHPQDCSEDALQAASSLFGDAFSFLRACKRMFLEVVDDVTATTDFHVADLQTLQLLVENSGLPHAPFSLEALNRSKITRLSITLIQRLKFFQTMSNICRASQKDQDQEDASKLSSNSKGNLNPEDNSNISFWPRLPSVLPTHLPGLRKFHLWLDYNRVCYWSVVNERSILAPVEALGTANPQLELVCVLPRVHPPIENRRRHYLPDDADQEGPARSRLKIHRIIR
ncbi:hypothetical protein B0T18DRAFT_195007 [Schizothecium vesticola]|uniref:Uncharacterized protein n=1 Tax=Schizothecium vesticola TaxID=314040 RepID=A0AA40ER96_9PEZI|nr:hypothetical protein B0T18DRAFT_195007 [Schizothecium vesticola]